MSEYTTSIRRLIDSGFDFGLNDYPIFDENYRPILNAKILRHYKFREIGQETPALFTEMLNRRMSEIMPLYNQFYKSTLLTFDPFQTYNLSTTSTRNINGNTTGTGNNTSSSTSSHGKNDTSNLKDVFSDTPQSQLTIGNIEANVYASTADIQNNSTTSSETGSINDNTSNTMSSTANNIDSYTSRVFGTDSARTNASILMEFRKSFINIDMDVIEDLHDLFMGVW